MYRASYSAAAGLLIVIYGGGIFAGAFITPQALGRQLGGIALGTAIMMAGVWLLVCICRLSSAEHALACDQPTHDMSGTGNGYPLAQPPRPSLIRTPPVQSECFLVIDRGTIVWPTPRPAEQVTVRLLVAPDGQLRGLAGDVELEVN